LSLVTIAEFPDRIAADLARLQLEAAGMDVVLFDGGMASLGLGMMTPVRLMVPDEHADEARALLDETA